MSTETARKIVVATALVGSLAIVYSGKTKNEPAKQIYKRVWGLLILATGGAVLADFAPSVVGPYLGLVLLGFLLYNRTGLGSLIQSGSDAVQGNASTGGA